MHLLDRWHLQACMAILRQLSNSWRRILPLGLIYFALAGLGTGWAAPTAEDGASLLKEANRLMNLSNQQKAAPLYESALRCFLDSGDRKNALAAKMGTVLAGIQQGFLPKHSAALEEYLNDPLVKGDDELKLRGLLAKGEIDLEINPLQAKTILEEADALLDQAADLTEAIQYQEEIQARETI